MTVSGSMVFSNGGRGDWFLIARTTTTESRATKKLVSLDPTITDESKNWEFGDLRKGNRGNVESNHNVVGFCTLVQLPTPMIGRSYEFVEIVGISSWFPQKVP